MFCHDVKSGIELKIENRSCGRRKITTDLHVAKAIEREEYLFVIFVVW
jgi:hypothetical protein